MEIVTSIFHQMKEEIIKKYLANKFTGYILDENEEELINMFTDIVNGLSQDIKYLKDETKRLVNENLNYEEYIEELKDQIKELKNKEKDY